VIRDERFPLNSGDSFNVYSNQLTGISGTFNGFVIPGRYEIAKVSGVSDDVLHIERIDRPATAYWIVSADQLRAILGNPWSDYARKAGP
jgi:hypothetical protein